MPSARAGAGLLLAGMPGPSHSTLDAPRSVETTVEQVPAPDPTPATARARTMAEDDGAADAEGSGRKPTPQPTVVTVPAIDVRSELIELGLREDRRLQVHVDHDDAGWFQYGPAPGATGPAVIAGHVDSLTGPAVFYRPRNGAHLVDAVARA